MSDLPEWLLDDPPATPSSALAASNKSSNALAGQAPSNASVEEGTISESSAYIKKGPFYQKQMRNSKDEIPEPPALSTESKQGVARKQNFAEIDDELEANGLGFLSSRADELNYKPPPLVTSSNPIPLFLDDIEQSAKVDGLPSITTTSNKENQKTGMVYIVEKANGALIVDIDTCGDPARDGITNQNAPSAKATTNAPVHFLKRMQEAAEKKERKLAAARDAAANAPLENGDSTAKSKVKGNKDKKKKPKSKDDTLVEDNEDEDVTASKAKKKKPSKKEIEEASAKTAALLASGGIIDTNKSGFDLTTVPPLSEEDRKGSDVIYLLSAYGDDENGKDGAGICELVRYYSHCNDDNVAEGDQVLRSIPPGTIAARIKSNHYQHRVEAVQAAQTLMAIEKYSEEERELDNYATTNNEQEAASGRPPRSNAQRVTSGARTEAAISNNSDQSSSLSSLATKLREATINSREDKIRKVIRRAGNEHDEIDDDDPAVEENNYQGQGLRQSQDDLSRRRKEREQRLNAFLLVIQTALRDRVFHVIVEACAAIDAFISHYKSDPLSTLLTPSEPSNISLQDIIFTGLIPKLKDNNNRVRDAVNSSLLNLSAHASVGALWMISLIARALGHNPQHNMTEPSATSAARFSPTKPSNAFAGVYDAAPPAPLPSEDWRYTTAKIDLAQTLLETPSFRKCLLKFDKETNDSGNLTPPGTAALSSASAEDIMAIALQGLSHNNNKARKRGAAFFIFIHQMLINGGSGSDSSNPTKENKAKVKEMVAVAINKGFSGLAPATIKMLRNEMGIADDISFTSTMSFPTGTNMNAMIATASATASRTSALGCEGSNDAATSIAFGRDQALREEEEDLAVLEAESSTLNNSTMNASTTFNSTSAGKLQDEEKEAIDFLTNSVQDLLKGLNDAREGQQGQTTDETNGPLPMLSRTSIRSFGCLFSNRWKLRERIVMRLESVFSEVVALTRALNQRSSSASFEPSNALNNAVSACCYVVIRALRDNVPAVAAAGISLTTMIVEWAEISQCIAVRVADQLATIIAYITPLTAATSTSDLALSVLCRLARLKEMRGLHRVLAHILSVNVSTATVAVRENDTASPLFFGLSRTFKEGTSSSNDATLSSSELLAAVQKATVKTLCPKLDSATHLLTIVTEDRNLNITQMLKFATACCQHAQLKVRSSAASLIVALYRRVGDQIQPMLLSLLPNRHMEELRGRMSKITNREKLASGGAAKQRLAVFDFNSVNNDSNMFNSSIASSTFGSTHEGSSMGLLGQRLAGMTTLAVGSAKSFAASTRSNNAANTSMSSIPTNSRSGTPVVTAANPNGAGATPKPPSDHPGSDIFSGKRIMSPKAAAAAAAITKKNIDMESSIRKKLIPGVAGVAGESQGSNRKGNLIFS